jgi:hypothetical protein
MAWSDPVTAYCERAGPGLTGEPLNALSNIGFVLAAVAMLRLQSQMRARGVTLPADIRALPWLVLAVAACSLLFHTVATRWAGALDSLSILLFCAVGVCSFLRHATALGTTLAAAGGAAFALASFTVSRSFAANTLNGSAAYLPNLLILAACTGYLGVQRAPATRRFALATVVFAIALALRTVDLAWCARVPAGTHFLWHLLTGLLVWIVGSELTLRRYGTHHYKVGA